MKNKLKEILSGWTNFVFENKAAEIIAKQRAKFCSKCPSAIKGKWLEGYLKDKSIKEVSGLKCEVCNCPLSAKTRSPESSCPLSKW